MSFRTTFALDQATAHRLKKLSTRWQVSQAEVVRRAVAMAEEAEMPDASATKVLKDLHLSGGGLVREQGEAYLAEVRSDRRDWRAST